MKQFKVTLRRVIDYPPQLVNALDEYEARRVAVYHGLTAVSDTVVAADIEEVDARVEKLRELAKELGAEQIVGELLKEFSPNQLIVEIEDFTGRRYRRDDD